MHLIPELEKKQCFLDSCIVGQNTILVPYCKHHVTKYHEWMLNKSLLDSTASESLTLSEEYEMQEKWSVDLDKATFIILSKRDYCLNTSTSSDHRENEVHSMVGDINAFFSFEQDCKGIVTELEIMIAEEQYRRMGFAREALDIFMHWICSHIPYISRFIAKIHTNNESSMNLFRKKLGFTPFARVDIFNETHLELLSPFSFTCEYTSKNYSMLYDETNCNKLVET